MADEHVPERPKWLCRACGKEWPCDDAKRDLTAEFRGASASLGVYLAGCWMGAMADLPHAAPTTLYRRMIGWRRERR